MEEILEKYKSIKSLHRILLCAVLGLSYPSLTIFEEIEDVDSRLEAAIAARDSAKTKWQNDEAQVSKLPSLEARSNEVNAKLEVARKYLPPTIKFDEILKKFGTYEQELQVGLDLFQPGLTSTEDTVLRFAEVPLQIELSGKFGNTMLFLDKIVHADHLVHLRSLNFLPEVTEIAANTNLSPNFVSQISKEEANVKVKVELVYFRSMGIN